MQRKKGRSKESVSSSVGLCAGGTGFRARHPGIRRRRISGIQKKTALVDTGSRPPQADSSGMTIFGMLFSRSDGFRLGGVHSTKKLAAQVFRKGF